MSFEQCLDRLMSAQKAIVAIAEEAAGHVQALKLQERQLADNEMQAVKRLKKVQVDRATIEASVHRYDEERRRCFSNVEYPAWDVRHHFHMTALESFRGNPQVIRLSDVATLFPDHLRVLALAKATADIPHSLSQQALIVDQDQIEYSERMVKLAKSRAATVNDLDNLQRLVLDLRKLIDPALQRELLAKQQKAKGYLNIKRRYFKALERRPRSLHQLPSIVSDAFERPEATIVVKESVSVSPKRASVSVRDWLERANNAIHELATCETASKQAWDAQQLAAVGSNRSSSELDDHRNET